MELLEYCPVCNSETAVSFLKCQDQLVSKDFFDLQKCSNCQFVFTNPRPNFESIQSYYASEDYYSHQNNSKSLISFVYNSIRNINISHKIKLIQNYKNNGSTLLDYGCGAGLFLGEARKYFSTVSGIEPNDQARMLAQERSLDVFTPEQIDQIEMNSQDVISLWHVLEHIHNLNEVFDKLTKCLKDEGIMCVALPNIESWDAVHYQSNWAAYDVPRHLYHFSRNSLKLFCEKYGMKIVGIEPMKFDAFYVSLLSESNALLKYPKAILKGLYSNLRAKKHLNHSSLIYILKKQ